MNSKNKLLSTEKALETIVKLKESKITPSSCKREGVTVGQIVLAASTVLIQPDLEEFYRDVLRSLSSFEIKDQYEVLQVALKSNIDKRIVSSIVLIVTNFQLCSNTFFDISDVLKSSFITVQDRVVLVKKQFDLFLQKRNNENLVFLFCGLSEQGCRWVLTALFDCLNKICGENEDFDIDKQYMLVSLASESNNKNLLRILTMVIKYNFGVISLRGIIRETNLHFNIMNEEDQKYIMTHKENEFFYDF